MKISKIFFLILKYHLIKGTIPTFLLNQWNKGGRKDTPPYKGFYEGGWGYLPPSFYTITLFKNYFI